MRTLDTLRRRFSSIATETAYSLASATARYSADIRNSSRRHPPPAFTPELRTQLGDLALALGHAAGYESAGTVEFLFSDGSLYFLEMNTRIQVEHTVTEEVFGIDLVVEQLKIAMGETLSITETPDPVGHAIEFRINAEDPSRGFIPTPGMLMKYREPSGPGIRVDSGVSQGSTISQYYDNMVAKLIVTGRDRAEAIRRARRALREFQVGGVDTTIGAHLQILEHESFLSGDVTTRLCRRLNGLHRSRPGNGANASQRTRNCQNER